MSHSPLGGNVPFPLLLNQNSMQLWQLCIQAAAQFGGELGSTFGSRIVCAFFDSLTPSLTGAARNNAPCNVEETNHQDHLFDDLFSNKQSLMFP